MTSKTLLADYYYTGTVKFTRRYLKRMNTDGGHQRQEARAMRVSFDKLSFRDFSVNVKKEICLTWICTF